MSAAASDIVDELTDILCVCSDEIVDAVRRLRTDRTKARNEIENLRALYDGSADGDAVIQLVVNRIAQHVYPSEEL